MPNVVAVTAGRTRQNVVPMRSNQQGIFAHYLQALRDRHLYRVDERTIQFGIRFLRTKADFLKAVNEYQTLVHQHRQLRSDLAVGEAERDLRLAEIAAKRIDIARQQHIGLQRLMTQLEAARLKRQIRQESSNTQEAQLTPEQRRLLKKAELEARLAQVEAEEARMLRTTASEAERRRLQNMYANRREQLLEQLQNVL